MFRFERGLRPRKLRMARLGRTGPSPWPSCGSDFRMARLGRTGPSPWPSCGSDFRLARLGRTGPSPWPSCGSHCVSGGSSEGAGAPLRLSSSRNVMKSGADLFRPGLHPLGPDAGQLLPGHLDPALEAPVEGGGVLLLPRGWRIDGLAVGHVVPGEVLVPQCLVLRVGGAVEIVPRSFGSVLDLHEADGQQGTARGRHNGRYT